MRVQLGTVGVLILCAAAIAAISGWVMNIVSLIGALNGPITAMFIARCVGVFLAPFGAILGYF